MSNKQQEQLISQMGLLTTGVEVNSAAVTIGADNFEEITGTSVDVVKTAHKALSQYHAVTALATAELGNQYLQDSKDTKFEATYEVVDGLSFQHVFSSEENINGEIHHNRLRCASVMNYGDADDLTSLAIKMAHEISEEGYLFEEEAEVATEEAEA